VIEESLEPSLSRVNVNVELELVRCIPRGGVRERGERVDQSRVVSVASYSERREREREEREEPRETAAGASLGAFPVRLKLGPPRGSLCSF
jgi:hypothetical protein